MSVGRSPPQLEDIPCSTCCPSSRSPLRRPTVGLTAKGHAALALYRFLELLDTLGAEERDEVTDLAFRELTGTPDPT